MASTETVISLSDGLHIGNATTDRIGLYGATPVAQPANTSTSRAALQSFGLMASGGVDYGLQHAMVALSAANLIAMYTTPVALVAAQGTGKSIVVAKLVFRITRTSTAFTIAGGPGLIFVQYAATAHGGGTQALDSTLATTVVSGAAGVSDSFRNGAVISDAASTVTENVGLYISNDTAAFAAGTGTAVVDIWYYVI